MNVQQGFMTAWKFCLSFFKKDWQLHDYPIVVNEQQPDAAFPPPRFSQHRFKCRILNWPLTGGGDTRDAALSNLRDHFETAKQERRTQQKALPRPGTQVPIEFATADRVHTHPELVDDFIRRVLGLEWAWISDESSLWDFHTDQTNATLQAKVKEIYGVDISDIESANLADIFDRLQSVRAKG